MTEQTRSHAFGRGAGAPPPPRLAVRLLEFCTPEPAADALVGDLHEEYAHAVLAGRGREAARRWFWRQALRSLWPGLTMHAEPRSLGRVLGGVVLGVAILWVVGDLAMTAAIAVIRAAWPGGPPSGSLLEGAYLLGLTPVAILAGYGAARQGKPNGALAALALVGVLVLPLIVVAVTGRWTPPYWSHAAWAVLGPLAVVVGAHRHLRRGAA